MKIKVDTSKVHGLGIFTKEKIYKNEIIEICPVIILSQIDTKKIDETRLYNYYFSWKDNESSISLGYGSLYNHSYEPNAMYIKDYEKSKIVFIAIKNIEKGEEIFVNYNGEPLNKEKVWFDK